MIDEKGRLFGKINLVDLLIVLVLIAAAVFLGVKLLGPGDDKIEEETYTLTLMCEEAPDFVVERLEKGAEVWDGTDYLDLGTLVDWTAGPSLSSIADINGNIVRGERDGYYSLVLTVECVGTPDDHGIRVQNSLLSVGHSMVIYAGEAKLWLKISDID